MEERSRQTTVLFADVSGSASLYETAGDVAALDVIERCIERLSQAAESTGGRVLKTMGDEVMVLFPTPDAAASAASEMHAAVDTLPPVRGTKLGVRIGFHSGPVIQRGNDVFGDTVNLAARLVEHAQKGQIVTSEETLQQLSPALRACSRRLHAIPIKGKADRGELCEIERRPASDAATDAAPPHEARSAAVALRLRYRDLQLVHRRENDLIIIGRDAGCGLVIAGENVSRLHCTIVRRHDSFVLRDHSTNGTFVTVDGDGDGEILVQREDMPLRRHGWLALGEPRAETAEVVAYFVD
jgi:adenylate cyclase